MRADIESLKQGLLQGSRRSLAKALTLIESRRGEDRPLALELLASVYRHRKASQRIGISGSPGVGKSTFIESFGQLFLQDGRQLAILTVDPSSPRSQGSILGDKTRMESLAYHPACFIRPSPAGLSLGGVARRTREAILLCEAAGFDTVMIETVGVGQSEHAIATMVDVFMCLTLPHAGDQLQGIKKGILELADLIVVTKADGSYLQAARRALVDHKAALHYQRLEEDRSPTQVFLCSALEKSGLDEIYKAVQELLNDQAVRLQKKRVDQNQVWYRTEIYEQLMESLLAMPALKLLLEDMQSKVDAAELPPPTAARSLILEVLQRFRYESH